MLKVCKRGMVFIQYYSLSCKVPKNDWIQIKSNHDLQKTNMVQLGEKKQTKLVPRLLEGQIIQVYEIEVLFYLVSCSFDVVLGQYILML